MKKDWNTEFIALLFAIFLQVSGGIWWASQLQSKQESHSEWIAKHQAQQEDYPVLQSRITRVEDSVNKLVQKLDVYIDEIRKTRGGNQ